MSGRLLCGQISLVYAVCVGQGGGSQGASVKPEDAAGRTEGEVTVAMTLE